MASMASNGSGLGSSTKRALTVKSLCVPSGEDDTHRSSLFFVFTECRMSVAFDHCFGTVCYVSCWTVLGQLLVSLFTDLPVSS